MNIFSYRNEQWFVYEYVLAELRIFTKFNNPYYYAVLGFTDDMWSRYFLLIAQYLYELFMNFTMFPRSDFCIKGTIPS